MNPWSYVRRQTRQLIFDSLWMEYIKQQNEKERMKKKQIEGSLRNKEKEDVEARAKVVRGRKLLAGSSRPTRPVKVGALGMFFILYYIITYTMIINYSIIQIYKSIQLLLSSSAFHLLYFYSFCIYRLSCFSINRG